MGFLKNTLVKTATKSTVNSALKYIDNFGGASPFEAAMIWLETRPSAGAVKVSLDLDRKANIRMGLDVSQDVENIITSTLGCELDLEGKERFLMKEIVQSMLRSHGVK